MRALIPCLFAFLLGTGLPAFATTFAERITPPAEARHADLLTGGLGLEGLRGPIPALLDPANPRFEELRQRALWSNWRGIADVTPGGGLGEVYGDLSPVPGREFHAESRLPGARHPHRMLLLLPDRFDPEQPCLVVSASSGSRGVYGAIAIAGGWGLPRGCAVASTDKGAGTDWRRIGDDGIHIPHAHSGDHPEADWGRHLLQTAAFAARQIEHAYGVPPERLSVLLLGLSNGGTAVLQAAGLASDPGLELGHDDHGRPWRAPPLAAVVAAAPNIHVEGARPLFDYATEAALLDPMQAEDRATLLAGGWTEAALTASMLSTPLDLWRTIAAAYASAYLRRGPDAMPGDYRYTLRAADGSLLPPHPAETALWWSDSSGIPPGHGVLLLDPPGSDTRRAGLERLRALWTGTNSDAQAVRNAIAATRPQPPPASLPILVVHGRDDGLVPEPFSTKPYVTWARAHGALVTHWSVMHVQHFDAFLGLPVFAARYLPLMPYAWAAADALWAHRQDGADAPFDRKIEGRPRGLEGLAPPPLQAGHLGLSEPPPGT